MLFYSPAFLPFFVAVFAAYWLLPWRTARTWVLLAGSFYFYATWNHWLALIIAVTSAADYAIARGLDATEKTTWRRGLMGFSLVMNLGLLAYFKYMNFFLDSLAASFQAAGMSLSLPTVQVILPIGISFYTFEAINYTVDVYRKQVPAERNLAHFLLFITFFPHLVAGPIVRARDFLPQIAKPKRWDWLRLQVGVEFFLLGLIKKLVIADRLSVVVDAVYANPDQYRSASLWIAVICYSLQIYCDFSGYSDMAIGLAHAFGFKLAKNFDMPYLAASVSEFWRRWHISLSTWLRDYLFIPLGGSRGSRWQTCRNLLITMTLGGLWHGASWTFVLWGVVHGLLLIVHRLWQDAYRRWPRLKPALAGEVGRGACQAATFLAISLTWVFFRAPTFEVAQQMFAGLFTLQLGQRAPIANEVLLAMLGAVASGHLLGIWPRWRTGWHRGLAAPGLGVAYGLLIVGVLLLIPDGTRPFIYFQF